MPFAPELVSPASVDLRWSGAFRTAGEKSWGDVFECSQWEFERGTLFLLDTLEYLAVPQSCAGLITLKSSLGRQGLKLLHVGWADPGFKGTLSFQIEVRAPWPVELQKGQPIIQLALLQLQHIPESLYDGHYQDQQIPTISWKHQ